MIQRDQKRSKILYQARLWPLVCLQEADNRNFRRLRSALFYRGDDPTHASTGRAAEGWHCMGACARRRYNVPKEEADHWNRSQCSWGNVEQYRSNPGVARNMLSSAPLGWC